MYKRPEFGITYEYKSFLASVRTFLGGSERRGRPNAFSTASEKQWSSKSSSSILQQRLSGRRHSPVLETVGGLTFLSIIQLYSFFKHVKGESPKGSFSSNCRPNQERTIAAAPVPSSDTPLQPKELKQHILRKEYGSDFVLQKRSICGSGRHDLQSGLDTVTPFYSQSSIQSPSSPGPKLFVPQSAPPNEHLTVTFWAIHTDPRGWSFGWDRVKVHAQRQCPDSKGKPKKEANISPYEAATQDEVMTMMTEAAKHPHKKRNYCGYLSKYDDKVAGYPGRKRWQTFQHFLEQAQSQKNVIGLLTDIFAMPESLIDDVRELIVNSKDVCEMLDD
ncbi:hypothetical protein DFS34DRAFT_672921 [Phlyctochytrium arcticum]|nr:hypothetical protein DFS34DRAFT_678135 [Phlyctochytrium arcticum]KAI9090003.1 hypothetical protein DFS34DRAFT_672921 [Phlyctochytrium arcticum]